MPLPFTTHTACVEPDGTVIIHGARSPLAQLYDGFVLPTGWTPLPASIMNEARSDRAIVYGLARSSALVTLFFMEPLGSRFALPESEFILPLPDLSEWIKHPDAFASYDPATVPDGFERISDTEPLIPGDLVLNPFGHECGYQAILMRGRRPADYPRSEAARYRFVGHRWTPEFLDLWFTMCIRAGFASRHAPTPAAMRKPITFRSTNSRPLPLP